MPVKQFNDTPAIKIKRCAFDLSHNINDTFNLGELVPFEVLEVLPNDTIKFNYTAQLRVSTTFLKPVTDNAFGNMYAFFVPYRLTQDNVEKVFANPEPSEYEGLSAPRELATTSGPSTVFKGSIADHFGLPQGTIGSGIQLAPFRAFALIYNHYFRNQNVQNSVYVYKQGIASSSESMNGLPWSPQNYMGLPPIVNKFKDLFTSCNPQPQKGSPVQLPFKSLSPVLPVGAVYQDLQGNWQVNDDPFRSHYGGVDQQLNLKYRKAIQEYFGLLESDPLFDKVGIGPLTFGTYMGPSAVGQSSLMYAEGYQPWTPNIAGKRDIDAYRSGGVYAYSNDNHGSGVSRWSQMFPVPDNLYALNESGININDLRLSVARQVALEYDALYGSFYEQYVYSRFGVTPSDARLQEPEFICGSSFTITKTTVPQTSAGDSSSPQGNLSAYSISGGDLKGIYSAKEHGVIIVCGFVRKQNTYFQGVSKMWTRKRKEDFYDPIFAQIGEQPVYKSELFALKQGDNPPPILNDEIFGYNEAYIEYKTMPNKVKGALSPAYADTLDIWNFAESFASAPSLTTDFVRESRAGFDRTLSAPSSSIDNFIMDCYAKITAYRPFPLYNRPSSLGLKIGG